MKLRWLVLVCGLATTIPPPSAGSSRAADLVFRNAPSTKAILAPGAVPLELLEAETIRYIRGVRN